MRQGDELVLPSSSYLAVKAPFNISNTQYVAFRIEDLDEETGELWLKYEHGQWNASHFEISRQINAEFFSSFKVSDIIIKSTPKVAYYDKNFNSDVNLNERLRATKPTTENLSELSNTNQGVSQKLDTINKEISVFFKEIKLEDGKATFNTNVGYNLGLIKFEIINHFIKKEYDAIKNYFEKVVGVKKIIVKIKIESIATKIIETTASSFQIDQINDSLIRRVEDAIVEDQYLNSEDEVFVLSDKLLKTSRDLGNDNVCSIDWLLDKVVTTEKTKHYFHLRYLSSKHITPTYNLMMTGKPTSFIFLLNNAENYYLIWETYTTEEATYIWRICEADKNKLQNEIEDLIEKVKWLRKGNKIKYIYSKPDNFKKIEHHYSGNDNGFKTWKIHLEKFTEINKAGPSS